jgi:hypothetical protein
MASETPSSSPDVRLALRPRWRDALTALAKAVDPWDRVLVVRSRRSTAASTPHDDAT